MTALVSAELDRINRELVRDLAPAEAELIPLIELIGRYRGKQLRPALVLLAAKATGGINETHVTVAKVVELIHTATLVHDDILDGGTLRRQLPTLNSLHGNEISVLLGDYVYAKAFHLAVQLEDQTCSRVLSDVTRVICQGEITQLLHRCDFSWNEARYERVITEKTASLFAAAARLGAYYAGASAAEIESMQSFGQDLGIAFQIVDDCLDLRGDETMVGKTLGTDLEKGKLTLPLLYLLRSHPDAERLLRQAVGVPGGMARLAEMDLEGAVGFALERAEQHLAKAVAVLQRLPCTPASAALEELAHYVVRREL